MPALRTGLRLFSVLLLLLAALGPTLPLRPGLTLVVLDASPSAREGTRKAVRALKVAGPVRFLAFAGEARLIKNPHALPDLGRNTDLEPAWALAERLHPSRILLISDGLLTPRPPPAPVFAFVVPPARRVVLTGLVPPAAPLLGERVELVVRLFATAPARVKLKVQIGETEKTLARSLPEGLSSVGVRFTLKGPTPVVVRLGDQVQKARIQPAGRLRARVYSDPAAARYLKAQQILVEEGPLTGELPPLVVVGGPYDEASAKRLVQHLDEGGGVLFTATPKGLFFGGWEAFEDLPLKPRPGPGAAFLLVLDTSGSMAGAKLEAAKEGTRGAIEAARPEDVLGLLAFSSSARWVLPPKRMTYRAKREAETALANLGAGGGTRLAPALSAARAALGAIHARKKLALVVTDGVAQDQKAALAEARRLEAAGAELHALALGPDADRAFLKRLAAAGGGGFYAAETRALARLIAGMAKATFRPEKTKGQFPLTLLHHPVTRGLSPPPPLSVRLPAVKKPWAEAVLKSGAFDVLALGTRRRGRVAALATDLSLSLKDWPDTPRLLGNLARWLTNTPARPRVRLGEGALVVEGRFDEPLYLKIAGRTLPIPPVAPWRYRLELPPGLAGEGLVYEGAKLRFRLALGGAREWQGEGQKALKKLAETSGGALLKAPRLGPPPREPYPLWQPLTLLALLLLLLERALTQRAVD